MTPHFETPLDAAKYAFENGDRGTALRIVIDYLRTLAPAGAPEPVDGGRPDPLPAHLPKGMRTHFGTVATELYLTVSGHYAGPGYLLNSSSIDWAHWRSTQHATEAKPRKEPVHPLATKELVASVRLRISQGDCPTEPPLSRETLEGLVDSIAPRRLKLLVDDEWLRKRIATDRDVDTEAGLPLPLKDPATEAKPSPPSETTANERSERFGATTGALTWNYRSAAEHPDRCVCQGDEAIPHKHYRDAPHACARCVACKAYRPAVPAHPREPASEPAAGGKRYSICSAHRTPEPGCKLCETTLDEDPPKPDGREDEAIIEMMHNAWRDATDGNWDHRRGWLKAYAAAREPLVAEVRELRERIAHISEHRPDARDIVSRLFAIFESGKVSHGSGIPEAVEIVERELGLPARVREGLAPQNAEKPPSQTGKA